MPPAIGAGLFVMGVFLAGLAIGYHFGRKSFAELVRQHMATGKSCEAAVEYEEKITAGKRP